MTWVPAAEDLLDGLGEVADRGGRRLLDEQVAGVGVLEGELHEVDRLVRFMRKRVMLGSVTVSGSPFCGCGR